MGRRIYTLEHVKFEDVGKLNNLSDADLKKESVLSSIPINENKDVQMKTELNSAVGSHNLKYKEAESGELEKAVTDTRVPGSRNINESLLGASSNQSTQRTDETLHGTSFNTRKIRTQEGLDSFAQQARKTLMEDPSEYEMESGLSSTSENTNIGNKTDTSLSDFSENTNFSKLDKDISKTPNVEVNSRFDRLLQSFEEDQTDVHTNDMLSSVSTNAQKHINEKRELSDPYLNQHERDVLDRRRREVGVDTKANMRYDEKLASTAFSEGYQPPHDTDLGKTAAQSIPNQNLNRVLSTNPLNSFENKNLTGTENKILFGTELDENNPNYSDELSPYYASVQPGVPVNSPKEYETGTLASLKRSLKTFGMDILNSIPILPGGTNKGLETVLGTLPLPQGTNASLGDVWTMWQTYKENKNNPLTGLKQLHTHNYGNQVLGLLDEKVGEVKNKVKDFFKGLFKDEEKKEEVLKITANMSNAQVAALFGMMSEVNYDTNNDEAYRKIKEYVQSKEFDSLSPHAGGTDDSELTRELAGLDFVLPEGADWRELDLRSLNEKQAEKLASQFILSRGIDDEVLSKTNEYGFNALGDMGVRINMDKILTEGLTIYDESKFFVEYCPVGKKAPPVPYSAEQINNDVHFKSASIQYENDNDLSYGTKPVISPSGTSIFWAPVVDVKLSGWSSSTQKIPLGNEASLPVSGSFQMPTKITMTFVNNSENVIREYLRAYAENMYPESIFTSSNPNDWNRSVVTPYKDLVLYIGIRILYMNKMPLNGSKMWHDYFGFACIPELGSESLEFKNNYGNGLVPITFNIVGILDQSGIYNETFALNTATWLKNQASTDYANKKREELATAIENIDRKISMLMDKLADPEIAALEDWQEPKATLLLTLADAGYARGQFANADANIESWNADSSTEGLDMVAAMSGSFVQDQRYANAQDTMTMVTMDAEGNIVTSYTDMDTAVDTFKQQNAMFKEAEEQFQKSFQDTYDRQEENKMLDEAINNVKNGKKDDELTPEEKSKIDTYKQRKEENNKQIEENQYVTETFGQMANQKYLDTNEQYAKSEMLKKKLESYEPAAGASSGGYYGEYF